MVLGDYEAPPALRGRRCGKTACVCWVVVRPHALVYGGLPPPSHSGRRRSNGGLTTDTTGGIGGTAALWSPEEGPHPRAPRRSGEATAVGGPRQLAAAGEEPHEDGSGAARSGGGEDDNDGKPFKVENPRGHTRWYKEEEVVLHSRRLRVGDRVRLAPTVHYPALADKCLTLEDVGKIIKDDNDDTPFKVQCNRTGKSNFYKAGHLYFASELEPSGEIDTEQGSGSSSSSALNESTKKKKKKKAGPRELDHGEIEDIGKSWSSLKTSGIAGRIRLGRCRRVHE